MGQIAESKRIPHLLRRAGFGASPEEIAAFAQLGFAGAVDRLVDYEAVPNGALDAQVTQLESELDLTKLPAIQTIWLTRMLRTARPLEEKMTLFWHDHFATGNAKVGRPQAMYDQNTLFRANALGNFRTLLQGVSRDPAMLRWLDSNANRKASPNENFARELMELFTMGEGNYTELDVREAARAFTGWFVNRQEGFAFNFNRNQHDAGAKTILGRTGNWDGGDVIDILLEQPATAQFMATKLFTFFVHDHPAPSTINRLADTFRGSGYEVRELVRAILHSPELSSDEAYHALVKSPAEHVVGTMKTLGIDEVGSAPLGLLNRMGMALFNPPSVAGWAWGAAWINTATLLERLNAAPNFMQAGGKVGEAALLERFGGPSPSAIVARLLDALVDDDVPPSVRSAIETDVGRGAATQAGAPIRAGAATQAAAFAQDSRQVERAVHGAIRLIMALPVYQLA
jgi:uncharacterized protein (DUF1800 family)